MTASDCPSANTTVVEAVVKTVVSEGVILHVAVTSPMRPADRRILQPKYIIMEVLNQLKSQSNILLWRFSKANGAPVQVCMYVSVDELSWVLLFGLPLP